MRGPFSFSFVGASRLCAIVALLACSDSDNDGPLVDAGVDNSDAGVDLLLCGPGVVYHLGGGFLAERTVGVPNAEPGMDLDVEATFVAVVDGRAQWRDVEDGAEMPGFELPLGALAEGERYAIRLTVDLGPAGGIDHLAVIRDAAGVPVVLAISGSIPFVEGAFSDLGLAVEWVPRCTLRHARICYSPNLHYDLQLTGAGADAPTAVSRGAPVVLPVGDQRLSVLLEEAVAGLDEDLGSCADVPLSFVWLTAVPDVAAE